LLRLKSQALANERHGQVAELASPHNTLAAADEVNRIDECHIAARSAVNRVAVAVAGMDPVVARREL
jgi:hypothetical protein